MTCSRNIYKASMHHALSTMQHCSIPVTALWVCYIHHDNDEGALGQRTCIDSTACLRNIVVGEVIVVDVGVCHARHKDSTTRQSSVIGEAGVFNSQTCAVDHVDGTSLRACVASHPSIGCGYLPHMDPMGSGYNSFAAAVSQHAAAVRVQTAAVSDIMHSGSVCSTACNIESKLNGSSIIGDASSNAECDHHAGLCPLPWSHPACHWHCPFLLLRLRNTHEGKCLQRG